MNIPIIDFTGITFVDSNGKLTAQAAGFMNQLLDVLAKNIGDEGVVIPTQTSSNPNNVASIQNHQNQQGQYTCALGTLLYDSTTNQLKVALNNSGTPLFKTITTS